MSSFDYREGTAGGIPDRVAASCALFEEQWSLGTRPDIAEFLERTGPDDRPTLLTRLIRIDVRERLLRGETPAPTEYVTRFPNDGQTILGMDWAALTAEDPDRLNDRLADTRQFPTPRRKQIGRFELLERIGVGGFGEVWLAFDTRLQREVAVKFSHYGADDAEQLDMLLHEARSAGRLKHRGIVSVHEASVEDGIAYIVSDYIAGSTLGERLKAGPLSFHEAARLAAGLADAVAHAHERGIIHRDIKPANVLLDAQGEPHLTDFGVARRASGEMTISKAGQALGTPAYMAPEQAGCQPGELDHRVDIYAIGLLLYEMIAARRAYPGDAREALQRVLLGPPQRLRLFRPDVPRPLEAIIEAASARKRDDRYASAGELAADLNRYLDGEPILAATSGGMHRGRNWVRQRPLVAGVAALMLLLSIAGLVGVAANALKADGHQENASTEPVKRPVVPSLLPADAPPLPATPHDAGLRRVLLETRPTSASVWIFPLDKATGWPVVEQRQDLEGVSPNWIDLAPGEYLVVADLGNGRFNEVFRWIPDESEKASFTDDNLDWKAHDNGTIGIDVPIPRFEPDETFVVFPANDAFIVDGGENDGPQRLAVPAFLLARRELTNHQFCVPDGDKRAALLAAPAADAALLRYDEAASGLERLGMRLPDEWEWESAARFGSPDFAAIAAQAKRSPPFGRAGLPSADLIGPGTGVFGLYSNVAELTSSSPIRPWDEPPPAFSTGDLRIVRGGGENVQDGANAIDAASRDPRARHTIRRSSLRPGVGVRGVRSLRPRREPQDFVRHLGPAGSAPEPSRQANNHSVD